MAAATVTAIATLPIGPRRKIALFTVTLVNPHTAAGDTVDLSDTGTGQLPNVVDGAWQVGQSDGFKLDYVRAALGDPATGKIHGYYGDWDAVANGALITAAGQDLSGFSSAWIALGY